MQPYLKFLFFFFYTLKNTSIAFTSVFCLLNEWVFGNSKSETEAPSTEKCPFHTEAACSAHQSCDLLYICLLKIAPWTSQGTHLSPPTGGVVWAELMSHPALGLDSGLVN